MRRKHSLQSRLAGLLMTLFAVLWLGGAGLAWLDARHEVEEILDSHLSQAAALLMAVTPDTHARVDTPVLHRYAAKTALQLWRQDQLILRSANAPLQPLAPGAGPGFHTVQIAHQAWRVFASAGAQAGEQIQVGQALAARNAVLWAMFRSNLWPLLLMLPLLGLGTWLTIRHALKPVRQLGAVLDQRQAQSLERIETHDLPIEMRPMVASLNRLFQRIDDLLAAERRWTADAAHELRTPIAAIRAHAEVALRADQDSERAHALIRTLDGCDRATHLVTQLLMLSRLEHALPAAGGEVDVPSVARHVLSELAPEALAQGQQITLDVQHEWRLAGDAALFQVLLRNWVHNAIAHAGPQAHIAVTIALHEGVPQLSVEDSGQGLSEAHIQRLGERFFRPPGTRANGSGLGWSIAARVAQVHGLNVYAQRSQTLGGFSAVLRAA